MRLNGHGVHHTFRKNPRSSRSQLVEMDRRNRKGLERLVKTNMKSCGHKSAQEHYTTATCRYPQISSLSVLHRSRVRSDVECSVGAFDLISRNTMLRSLVELSPPKTPLKRIAETMPQIGVVFK